MAMRGTKSRLLAGTILLANGLAAIDAAWAGDITGVMVTPSTGKPAAGVTVSIPGTAYSTQSAADGTFALRGLPAGNYSLKAEGGGFHGGKASVKVPESGAVTASFEDELGPIDTLVIASNRYQATDLQLAAPNTVNVLSADDLAHTAVHNVAEALGALPGINVTNTGSGFIGGVDAASRGEGMYVSVRGLNSEYNINLINGVDVAQGSPYTRGVQLSLLPPSGLQTIALNKTVPADMDGDAIGGIVDFRTPSAFDQKGDLGGSFTVGGRFESRAADYGKNGLGDNVAADGFYKFGRDKQFGIYVSGFYDIRNYANSLVGGIQESGCCDFGWDYAVQGNLPTQNSAPGLDPAKNLVLTGANFGVSSGYTERYGGNVSFDWAIDDDTSLYIKTTYAHALTRQDSHLSQIVAEDKNDGNSGQEIGGTGFYQPTLGDVSIRYWYETNPETAIIGTTQIGGETKLDKWTIAPNVFGSWGSDDRPDHVEVATRVPDPGIPFGGTTLFTYANNFPQPLLTPAAQAALNNIPGLPTIGGQPEVTKQYSGQEKAGAKLDLTYDADGNVLKFIKFGAKYQNSWRDQTNRDYTVPSYGSATTFGGLGIVNGRYDPVYPGEYGWSIPDINQSALFNLFNSLGGSNLNAVLDTCGSPYLANELNCNTQKATEAVSAAYVMAQLNLAGFEVIPGFRFEHTDIHNIFWVTTDNGNALGHFGSNNTTYDVPLPSLFINYRPSNATVYRVSAYQSYVRPPFLQLGGGSNVSVSDGVITITQGNPHLKPVKATNYDIGGEWDSGAGGHLMLSGFYKRLTDYIYDDGAGSGVLGTTPGTGTTVTTPENGGSGTVYGVELAARQKFQGLPDPFDGLGISGNVTRQVTSVNLAISPNFGNQRIQNAPDILANAQIFYEKGPVDLELIYNYSGEYISIYDQLNQGAAWDNTWVKPIGRLDMHAGYKLIDEGVSFDLSISNLLKENSYWAHVGKDSYVISDIVNSGQTILFTASYKY